jgi:hypothetical protein
VYARETYFDNNAQPSEERTTVVLVDFHFLDNDPSREDCMVVRIHKLPNFNLRDSGLDQGWTSLIEVAADGFNRWCKPLPEKEQNRRAKFFEQMQKEEAGENAFRARVSGFDWENAISLVHEPWQLRVVTAVHCNGRFSQPDCSNCERVRRMLDAHQCTKNRRRRLTDMLYYLEAQDPRWKG